MKYHVRLVFDKYLLQRKRIQQVPVLQDDLIEDIPDIIRWGAPTHQTYNFDIRVVGENVVRQMTPDKTGYSCDQYVFDGSLLKESD